MGQWAESFGKFGIVDFGFRLFRLPDSQRHRVMLRAKAHKTDGARYRRLKSTETGLIKAKSEQPTGNGV